MELKQEIAAANAHMVVLLLIVPYGIETTPEQVKSLARLTFNRTLWN